MYSDELKHYGTPHEGYVPHSGRYAWGSGEEPFQGASAFFEKDNELRASGKTEKERADFFGISTNELREQRKIVRESILAANVARAVRLKSEKRYSTREIGRIMGKNESVIRKYLKYYETDKANKTKNTADMLMREVEEKGMIQVGSGVERTIGISQTQLNAALTRLKITEGLPVYSIQVDQLGTQPGNKTTVKVLTKKDITQKEVYDNLDKVRNIVEYSHDSGKTWARIKYPKSIDSKRILVKYSEDGGGEKDGVIELRRNVPDLSLQDSMYAQVRIAVDGDKFLKGMAVYSDDIPKGYDVIFNTSKTRSEEALKSMEIDKKTGKIDKENPFGANIKPGGQYEYVDKNGKKQLGAINIVNDQGDWGEWKKTIASQVLSKQSVPLAKRQLNITYDDRKAEYDTILSLTNPAVKKKLLESFADNCDSAASDLKASAFPRQSSCVILPVPELKNNEIYAPKYRNGETVVLIRYPHGGIFEIPKLKVNNSNKAAKKLIGSSEDAVCINSKVAEQLSGADFDGDTVLVIPTGKTPIKSSKPLEQLKDFNPRTAYPGYDGMPELKEATKQTEMGIASNLITDMTLKGADTKEIARAVKYSMVVIDAKKHKLNYKQAYKDYGIAALKVKYQGGTLQNPKGASTLISQANSEYRLPYTRREIKNINQMTPAQKKRFLNGEKIYERTDKTYFTPKKNNKGEIVEWVETPRNTLTTKMAETKDAYTLSSGTRMENVYADYANKMKQMANSARKEFRQTPNIVKSPSAAKTYASEVKSLDAKLDEALKNAPYERQAQMLANVVYKDRLESNPDIEKDDKKKLKNQVLTEARIRVGAKSRKERNIKITDKEWSAIQAGAIPATKLEKILNNTDLDELKERAMPRNSKGLTSAQISRIKTLMSAGYSASEVADRLGISTSTVYKALK